VARTVRTLERVAMQHKGQTSHLQRCLSHSAWPRAIPLLQQQPAQPCALATAAGASGASGTLLQSLRSMATRAQKQQAANTGVMAA
jgi:hypothetical protein